MGDKLKGLAILWHSARAQARSKQREGTAFMMCCVVVGGACGVSALF